MAVTLTKAKPKTLKSKAKAKAKVKDSGGDILQTLKDMTNALGLTSEQVDIVKAQMKVASQAYKKVADKFMEEFARLDTPEPDQFLVDGPAYQVLVSAESKARSVKNNKEVFDALKKIDPNLPFELMKFGLGDLDKYLGEHQLQKLLDHGYSGSRSLKVSVKEADED